MSSGVVFDIRKFSTHDGPGIRTSVFMKGCPLNCPWCHNPEGRKGRPELLRRVSRCVHCGECARFCPLGLEPKKEAGSRHCADCEDFGVCAAVCPSEAIQLAGSPMTSDEVMAVIRQDRAFYDESGGGATFTGGEPLSQFEFLVELLDACRSEGIHTAVETSGYASRERLLDLGHRADLLLFDLKHADAKRGSELVGVDYGSCLRNLDAAVDASVASVAEGGSEGPFAEIIVRMPIVPGCNDSPAELEAAAALVAGLSARRGAGGMDGHAPIPVHLLPYHDSAKGKYRLWGLDYPLSETPVPDDSAMSAALGFFTARGLPARIGG